MPTNKLDKSPTTAVARQIEPLKLDVEQITRTTSVFNANQIQKIFNSTQKKWTYDRPARGGGSWTYVKASYVRRSLDAIFGFNWDFDIETTVGEAFEVAKITGSCVVKGILSGRTVRDGMWHTVRKTQFGRAEVKFKKELVDGIKQPLDFGNDMKAAASDAFKKCASVLGIASDIYDPTEFIEIEVVGSDSATDRAKATEDKLKNARKMIKKQATKVETK